MQYDRNKMHAVLLHIFHACEKVKLGAVKLNKIIYVLDMIYYVHTRSSVTGATYRKRQNGPESDQLLFILRDIELDHDIEIRDVKCHGYIKKIIHCVVSRVARGPEQTRIFAA